MVSKTLDLFPISHRFWMSPNSTSDGVQPRGRPVRPCIYSYCVQCANCMKWRWIPTKETYEQIGERLTAYPFVCVRASEWSPTITCNDPADVYPDDSRVWVIDVPDVPLPPPGWEREVRIRSPGASQVADIYYKAPALRHKSFRSKAKIKKDPALCPTSFRSMAEIKRYLSANPCAKDAERLKKLSFKLPKPLNESYVRKRVCGTRNEVNPVRGPARQGGKEEITYACLMLPAPTNKN